MNALYEGDAYILSSVCFLYLWNGEYRISPATAPITPVPSADAPSVKTAKSLKNASQKLDIR